LNFRKTVWRSFGELSEDLEALSFFLPPSAARLVKAREQTSSAQTVIQNDFIVHISDRVHACPVKNNQGPAMCNSDEELNAATQSSRRMEATSQATVCVRQRIAENRRLGRR